MEGFYYLCWIGVDPAGRRQAMVMSNSAGHWYESLRRLRNQGHARACRCASCTACEVALGVNGMCLFESVYSRVGGRAQLFGREVTRACQARALSESATATRGSHGAPEPGTAPVGDDCAAGFEDRWRSMPDPQIERLKRERDRLRSRLSEIQERRAAGSHRRAHPRNRRHQRRRRVDTASSYARICADWSWVCVTRSPMPSPRCARFVQIRCVGKWGSVG